MGVGWLAWGAGVSLTPFLIVGFFYHYSNGAWPSRQVLFGTGQGLLPCVGMYGTAIREMQRPDLRVTWLGSSLGWVATIALLFTASTYGYLQSELQHQGGTFSQQTGNKEHDVATLTVVLLVLAVVTATGCVMLTKSKSTLGVDAAGKVP